MSRAADSIKHFTTDSGTFLLKNIFEVTTISSTLQKKAMIMIIITN